MPLSYGNVLDELFAALPAFEVVVRESPDLSRGDEELPYLVFPEFAHWLNRLEESGQDESLIEALSFLERVAVAAVHDSDLRDLLLIEVFDYTFLHAEVTARMGPAARGLLDEAKR